MNHLLKPTLLALLLAPALATASPEAIEALALDLPERSAAEVAAMAESHLAERLDPRYEPFWWHLVFHRWHEVDQPAAEAFAAQHPPDAEEKERRETTEFAATVADALGGDRSREDCLRLEGRLPPLRPRAAHLSPRRSRAKFESGWSGIQHGKRP
ncbi:hypothetical protein BH23VER1_BH23VER1_24060 [soil metagenome]